MLYIDNVSDSVALVKAVTSKQTWGHPKKNKKNLF